MNTLHREFAKAQVAAISNATRHLAEHMTDEPARNVLKMIDDCAEWLRIRLKFDRDEG